MFEKKTEKKPEKMNKENQKSIKEFAGGIGIRTILIPVVLAAVIVCLIYVAMDKASDNKVEMASVLVARESISTNTYVTQKNVSDYFETEEIAAALVPGNSYSDVSELPDKFYVTGKMAGKQMLTENLVTEGNASLDKYNFGYEVTSISVGTYDKGVAGTLRSGDIVDLYAVDPATDELILMAEDLYIEAAFDGSGERITEEGVATAFNIRVTEDDKEAINKAVTYGGIQLYLTKM